MGCGSSSEKHISSSENKPLTSRNEKQDGKSKRSENTSQNAHISEHGVEAIHQTEKRIDPHGTTQTSNLEHITKYKKTEKECQNAGMSKEESLNIDEIEKGNNLHGKEQILDLEETKRKETWDNSSHSLDKIKSVQKDIDNLRDDLKERIDEILSKETKETFDESHKSEQESIGKEQKHGKEIESGVTLGHDGTSKRNGAGEAGKENGDFCELEVRDAVMDDNSVVSLSQSKMDELDLFRGDTVLLKGKEAKETICIALTDDSVKHNEIAMNRCIRKNLCLKIGDSVRVQACEDLPYGKQICVQPFKDAVVDFTGDLIKDYLKPYFNEAYRPLHKGDVFTLEPGVCGTIDLKVTETDPAPYCVVAPETVITCSWEPLERETECSSTKEQSEVLRSFTLNKDVVHPKMKRKIESPRILLLDCSIDYNRGESHTNLEVAEGGDFEALIKLEEEHVQNMCDDIKALKPDLVITEGSVSDLAQHFLAKGDISVIGGVEKSENKKIAELSGATIACNTEHLSEENIGTGCGLFEIKKDGNEYRTYLLNSKDSEAGDILPSNTSQERSQDTVKPPQALLDDLQERITSVTTSAREIIDSDSNLTIEKNPTITNDDIAGLHEAKKELMEQILYPIMHQELFEKHGMTTSYVLLHGPPGCGKTMLSKAVAAEAQCCYISTKVTAGKYVPYTDDLRAAFDKARKYAPCVLFLDVNELTSRGGGSSAHDYLINQLLTELDGLDTKKLNTNLFVIGSVRSTRELDGALLRPGRLSHLIHVPLPDVETRTQIIKMTIGDTATAKSEDLEHLSVLTRGYTGADLVELCNKALKIAKESSKENMNDDKLPEIAQDDWTAAIETTPKSLSDKEVQFYEELNAKKDTFNFGFPLPPKGEEKHGAYKVGQFTTDDDDDLYDNGNTGNQLVVNGDDDDDDDDLYS